MYSKSLLVACLLAASVPVHAGNPFKPAEISDQELALLRGRYVLPDRIISFGVVMTSTWQNAAGQVIGAQASLNVTSGQLQPVLHVQEISSAGNGTAVADGTGVISGGNGLDSVNGIVQSVRTAGDLNSGLNDLRVQISSNGEASVTANDGQAWNGSQSFSNAAGTVNVSSRAGGINIALQAGQGQGFSSQQIGGGVAQHANISGALNEVKNIATLNVALRDNPQALSLANCVEQLRALRPHGY